MMAFSSAQLVSALARRRRALTGVRSFPSSRKRKKNSKAHEAMWRSAETRWISGFARRRNSDCWSSARLLATGGTRVCRTSRGGMPRGSCEFTNIWQRGRRSILMAEIACASCCPYLLLVCVAAVFNGHPGMRVVTFFYPGRLSAALFERCDDSFSVFLDRSAHGCCEVQTDFRIGELACVDCRVSCQALFQLPLLGTRRISLSMGSRHGKMKRYVPSFGECCRRRIGRRGIFKSNVAARQWLLR